MTAFGGSDSFVEDLNYDSRGYGKSKTAPQKTYFTNDDWSAFKKQTRKGTCDENFKITCPHNILFRIFLSHVKASNKSNDNYVIKSSGATYGPWSVIDSSSEKKSSKSLADIAGDWMARLHK